MEFFISLLTAFANLVLGLFTYLKNPKSATNKLFAFLALQISLWAVTNYFSLHSDTETMTLFWIRVVMFIAAPMGPTIFLLMDAFPDRKSSLSRSHLYLIWTLAFIIGLLALSPYMFISVSLADGNVKPTPGPAILPFAILFLGFIIAGGITIIKKYRLATGLLKVQIKFIILGVIATFSLISFTSFLLVVLFNNSSFVVFGPLFSLILIGSIAYAIVKHRFLDIQLLVARTVSYVLLIGLFGLLYSFTFAILSSIFIQYSLTSQTIPVSTFIALLMAFTFQPVRRIIEKMTDKLLYKDHYDTDRLLYDLTVILASTLRLEELTHLLLKDLLSQMRITRGAFILTTGGRIYEVAHEGYKESPELNEEQILQLENKNQTLVFDELLENPVKQIMRNYNFSIVIDLRSAGEQIGLLVLGEKLSGDIYTSEDIRVLEIFVPEAAVAVKNSLAYEEIQRFNITLKEEIKQATSNLAKANIRLKELDKLKDEFVSLASHELRTPMTAIKSYIWLSLNKSSQPLSPEVKKNLEISLQETEHLIKLVQNMLTISRIEGKRLQLNIEPVNVFDLTKQVYEELKIKADEKKIHFTIADYPEKLIVNGDKEKLDEVFQNIIGNAIKYTPDKGKVSISFSVEQDSIAIHVSDTGLGISKENMSKLFKKFGRIESKESRTSGTGLGLYITKQIVSVHKGEIKINSEVGKGTTFSVYLPLA